MYQDNLSITSDFMLRQSEYREGIFCVENGIILCALIVLLNFASQIRFLVFKGENGQ